VPKTYCPECDAVISVANPREGDEISCRGCGTEMEVINARPFEVDFPLDYYDDWEDTGYEDDED
jgi:lysine biosynthesis protein LysW